MSSGGNRKSMDDVLSSIRKIIGSDRKDDAASMPDMAADQEPLALGTPIGQGGAQDQQPGGDDGALSLTPNMRVDFSKLTDDNPLSGASPAAAPATPASPPPAAPAPAPAQPTMAPPPPPAPEPAPAPVASADVYQDDGLEDDEAVVIDEAALEDMIRRIVREEIEASGPDTGLIRQVVRDELMGETGQNISRNVTALIQAEVSKLKQG
ncbi:MAG: hypothetical protein AAFR79_15755 [Pseudomonadota bacterium]